MKLEIESFVARLPFYRSSSWIQTGVTKKSDIEEIIKHKLNYTVNIHVLEHMCIYLSVCVLMVFIIAGVIVLLNEAKIFLSLPL